MFLLLYTGERERHRETGMDAPNIKNMCLRDKKKILQTISERIIIHQKSADIERE